jgi:hypothetical protein
VLESSAAVATATSEGFAKRQARPAAYSVTLPIEPKGPMPTANAGAVANRCQVLRR